MVFCSLPSSLPSPLGLTLKTLVLRRGSFVTLLSWIALVWPSTSLSLRMLMISLIISACPLAHALLHLFLLSLWLTQFLNSLMTWRTFRSRLFSASKLFYYANMTSLDISTVVSMLIRPMSSLTLRHWEQAKCILRYVSSIRDSCLIFPISTELLIWQDLSFPGDIDRRYHTSFIFMISGGLVSWGSKLQRVSLSLLPRPSTWPSLPLLMKPCCFVNSFLLLVLPSMA
jgi:hypothetical protein